jgi:signal transduction histidine kinase
MRIAPASYRLRLPLSLSVAAITTAILMAVALGLQTLDNLREDQRRNALRLRHAMSEVLVQALRHDDVWLAYSLLRGPEHEPADVIWIVVDDRQRIFASNRPRRYRLNEPLADTFPRVSHSGPVPGVDDGQAARPPAVTLPDQARYLLRLPLASDGTGVGELIALLSDAPFLARFHEILLGGSLVTTTVLTILLPIGWLWGRRLATPLAQLAACMGRVGKEDPRRLRCQVPDGDSEIGELGRQFSAMLAALAEKDAVEQQMVQAERLAAVGRVAAGVAHEVNNPLGGMQMAIDTYRRSHSLDQRTAKLLDLLDRALQQIQGSVSALLVEARGVQRPLAPHDLEDVRTLIQPRLANARAVLTWHNRVTDALGLPAAPVRQLLLNLLLNAVAAAQDNGQVRVELTTKGSHLALTIDNTGAPIPAERLAHLFEPYPDARPQSQGLGLWICYQIVSQLGGEIQVSSDENLTRCRVTLPHQIGGRT